MTVDESWDIIHRWLTQHHPAMLSLLHGPAQPAALAALEAQTGHRLPDDFKRSYLIHDGSDSACGPLAGLPLMPLSTIASNWEMWASIADDDDADLNEPCRSHPAGAVRLRYANRGWLPFAGDGQNFVALDFDPGPAGTPAQVINTGRDDEMRHVIAPTFAGFLAFVARQFQAGRVVRSARDDRWLELAADGGDLLTGLRPLLGLPASYEP
jgi:cell wall assembly regulator SMI1